MKVNPIKKATKIEANRFHSAHQFKTKNKDAPASAELERYEIFEYYS